MTRAVVILLALVLAGCAHVHRQDPETKQPQRVRLVVVICLFASCHHLACPDDGRAQAVE
jgi:hypothetical protein